MIIRLVHMHFRKEDTATFKALFEENMEYIRNHEGCKHLELLEDVDNPQSFSTYSIWQSVEALDTYRNSELFKRVWTATKALFDAKPTAYSFKKNIMLP